MKFQTMDPANLPTSGHFGRERVFEDADVTAAIALLRKGQAVSDGTDYETRPKALNRAGVLRTRIHADEKAPRVSATAVENNGKFRWWLRVKPPTE